MKTAANLATDIDTEQQKSYPESSRRSGIAGCSRLNYP
jgi:hypothetical protein